MSQFLETVSQDMRYALRAFRGTPVFALTVILTLALAGAPLLYRFLRASLLEQINEPYVRTARGKGLTERPVVLRHAARNSLGRRKKPPRRPNPARAGRGGSAAYTDFSYPTAPTEENRGWHGRFLHAHRLHMSRRILYFGASSTHQIELLQLQPARREAIKHW